MTITIPALPGPFAFEPSTTALVIIDMQRDFIEPGGFGESLGNDVSLLAQIVPTVASLLALARESGWFVVHTRESHAADLSDCPPAKRLRGAPNARIGDEGPMGRVLIRGEPGNAIVDALAPTEGELVIDKPGKGAFYATLPWLRSWRRGISRASGFCRRHRRRYACRRRGAKRTTAVTTACLSRTPPPATSRRSSLRRWTWCGPRAVLLDGPPPCHLLPQHEEPANDGYQLPCRK